jgi:hypothetical protein
MRDALVYSLKAYLQSEVASSSIPPLPVFPSSPKAKGNNFRVNGVFENICGQMKSNHSGVRECF